MNEKYSTRSFKLFERMITFRRDRCYTVGKITFIVGLQVFGMVTTDYKDCWVQRGSYSYSIRRGHGGVNFQTASEICDANNASLASVHSEEENNFLDQMRKDQAVVPLWIGMRRKKYKRRWIDGTELDYMAPYEAVASIKACIYLYKSWYEGNCENNLFFFCKKEVKDGINTDEHCSIPTTLSPSPSPDVPSTSMSEDNWSSLHEISSWTHHSSMMEQTVSMHSSVFSSLDSSDLSTGVIKDLESTRPLEITPTVAESIIPTISTDVYLYSSDNSLEYSTSLENSISLESSTSLSSPVFETNFGSSAESSVSELSVSKTLMTGNHRSEYSTLLLSSNPSIDFSVTSESTHVTIRTELSSDSSLIFESSYHTSIMTEHSKYLSSSVLSSSHSLSSSMPVSKTTLSILPSSSTENMDVLRATSPDIILDSASSESQETAHFKNTYVPDLSTTTVTPHFDKDAFEKVLEDLRVKKRTKQVAKEAPGGETIGAVAMVILFVIFAGVVLLDLSTIQNHFKLFLRNIKGCRERKEEQNQIELTSL